MAGIAIIMNHLFCFGLGYSALHLARRLAKQGWMVSGTSRTAEGAQCIANEGFEPLLFDGTRPCEGVRETLARATHILVSVPPGKDGDPVLRHHASDLEAAPSIAWMGYLSTVGVYGDWHGAWVDEDTPPNPNLVRARRRVAAEASWLELGARTGRRVQVFRLSGIYGPGRSAIERLRAGIARRIVKPGQVFNRIHVDDIAEALSAAMAGSGTHDVYNVTDDEPAPPQDVITFAASILKMQPPPEIPFKDAEMSPMAASFYADNRRVSNARLRQDLGVHLKFPNYREGLRAIAALNG